MTSQLSYLIAQWRQAELVSRAERARLASEARRARSASAPLWDPARSGGYPPLCAHGMNSLTDRGYDVALGRLRPG